MELENSRYQIGQNDKMSYEEVIEYCESKGLYLSKEKKFSHFLRLMDLGWKLFEETGEELQKFSRSHRMFTQMNGMPLRMLKIEEQEFSFFEFLEKAKTDGFDGEFGERILDCDFYRIEKIIGNWYFTEKQIAIQRINRLHHVWKTFPDF